MPSQTCPPSTTQLRNTSIPSRLLSLYIHITNNYVKRTLLAIQTVLYQTSDVTNKRSAVITMLFVLNYLLPPRPKCMERPFYLHDFRVVVENIISTESGPLPDICPRQRLVLRCSHPVDCCNFSPGRGCPCCVFRYAVTTRKLFDSISVIRAMCLAHCHLSLANLWTTSIL